MILPRTCPGQHAGPRRGAFLPVADRASGGDAAPRLYADGGEGDRTLADTSETVSTELVSRLLDEEVDRLRGEVPPEVFEPYYQPAKKLISDMCLGDDFTDFLTLPAYEPVK
jgi:hypothetical protein